MENNECPLNDPNCEICNPLCGNLYCPFCYPDQSKEEEENDM